jgi:hypothetical protein
VDGPSFAAENVNAGAARVEVPLGVAAAAPRHATTASTSAPHASARRTLSRS